MTSRRGAVKINPVTGKMEAADPSDLTKHRDGSLMVDDKYVNMAKELGLGGAAGESDNEKNDDEQRFCGGAKSACKRCCYVPFPSFFLA